MRVIGGEYRGRRLTAPVGANVRPTSDRVREAIFDILFSLGGVEGLQVADLFAGTGALGIEALSRGAASVTFVEQRPPARSTRSGPTWPRSGLADAERRATPPWCGPTSTPGWPPTASRYDLVLCDPPYDYTGWEALVGAAAGRPRRARIGRRDRRSPRGGKYSDPGAMGVPSSRSPVRNGRSQKGVS